MNSNEKIISDIVRNIMSKQYKFKVPDKYFDEIKTKVNQEETLQGYFNRYINEILVLRLKDKTSVSHLKKYVKSSTVWRKMIPVYLCEAEKSYVKGHSSAAIFFCRLAIETALRDRLIKRKAKNKKKNSDLSAEEKKISIQTMNNLFQEACGKKMSILQEKDINKIFKNLKSCSTSFFKSEENIFNKFMHGDFVWIKNFIEKGRKITITYDEKTTKQFVASPNTISSFLFMDILEATYKTLLLLYPCKK